MLTEICAEIKNYFVKEIHHGTFTISGGVIEPLPFLQENQYFRIVGSVFNDGVYQYGTGEQGAALTDETFEGAVWAMGPPPPFIALTAEIEEWAKSDAAKASPYTSESYPNGYSYTLAKDAKGAPMTWKSVFASQLDRWRKIREI